MIDRRGAFAREVLHEGAAERDVEELDAATDREDRLFSLAGGEKEGQFGLVARNVGLAGRRMGRRAVARGIDVLAARQEETAAGVEQFARVVGVGERGNDDRKQTCTLDRPYVIRGKAYPLGPLPLRGGRADGDEQRHPLCYNECPVRGECRGIISSAETRSTRMFESLKAALQDLLGGRVAPADRRAVIADMKRALVSAKLGVDDLREGAELTRRRLAAEREALATMQRRKTLAEGINDAETVALAAKHEQQHSERIAVLEQKLAAQDAEFQLAEREVTEMIAGLKSANAGVGSGATAGSTGVTDEELGLPNDAQLNSELDSLARQQKRNAADASAEERLAELKRRMGQQ